MWSSALFRHPRVLACVRRESRRWRRRPASALVRWRFAFPLVRGRWACVRLCLFSAWCGGLWRRMWRGRCRSRFRPGAVGGVCAGSARPPRAAFSSSVLAWRPGGVVVSRDVSRRSLAAAPAVAGDPMAGLLVRRLLDSIWIARPALLLVRFAVRGSAGSPPSAPAGGRRSALSHLRGRLAHLRETRSPRPAPPRCAEAKTAAPSVRRPSAPSARCGPPSATLAGSCGRLRPSPRSPRPRPALPSVAALSPSFASSPPPRTRARLV